MIAQLQVQNPDNRAGVENRWSDLLRIAITPTAWGTDFHAYVISIVLNIPIFIFTSFICERGSQHSYYIDPSLDLTAYFCSHGERITAHQLHCSEDHVQVLLNEPYERWIRDPICTFFNVDHFVGLVYTSASHKQWIPVPYSRWYHETQYIPFTIRCIPILLLYYHIHGHYYSGRIGNGMISILKSID